jgi:hypothetical protein
MVETVLDWRPFDYYTVEQVFGPVSERATFRLTPATGGGTRLQVYERCRITSLEFLDRLIASIMLTRLMPTTKLLEMLGRRIADDLDREEFGHR